MFPGDWAATGRLDGGDARVLSVRHSLVRPGLGWGVLFCVSRLTFRPPPRPESRPEKICLMGGASKRMLADAHMGPADAVHPEHSGGFERSWGGSGVRHIRPISCKFLLSYLLSERYEGYQSHPETPFSRQTNPKHQIIRTQLTSPQQPAKRLSVGVTLRAAYNTAFPSWHAGPSIALDPAYR